MSKDYVTYANGGYRICNTRVSLDSVVYAFLHGQSPESIVDSFPILTLEQVYGAIAYYLANQAEVDAYLQQGEADFAALRERLREHNLLLHQKLTAFRQQQPAATSEPGPTQA
ncbi:MAG: DUF433 domain-containing protein [Candidatus Binatia bacterium]